MRAQLAGLLEADAVSTCLLADRWTTPEDAHVPPVAALPFMRASCVYACVRFRYVIALESLRAIGLVDFGVVQTQQQVDAHTEFVWGRLRDMVTTVAVKRESPQVKLRVQASVPPRFAVSFDELGMDLHLVQESHVVLDKVSTVSCTGWLGNSHSFTRHECAVCVSALRTYVVRGTHSEYVRADYYVRSCAVGHTYF